MKYTECYSKYREQFNSGRPHQRAWVCSVPVPLTDNMTWRKEWGKPRCKVTRWLPNPNNLVWHLFTENMPLVPLLLWLFWCCVDIVGDRLHSTVSVPCFLGYPSLPLSQRALLPHSIWCCFDGSVKIIHLDKTVFTSRASPPIARKGLLRSQKCRFMGMEVREISHFYVAPPHLFPLSVCVQNYPHLSNFTK